MRKYQQLCLIVISLVSVVVLLMYRSENSRLKYVLEVVNFFGRSDNAIVRLENTTKIFIQNYDLVSPMPSWTRIGTDFHVYSTFWSNNTLKAGGLESISLVAGIGNVQFQCEMEFENGKSQRGKFMFAREDVSSDAHNDAKSEKFMIYTFICKINRDFGYPKKIIFIDTNSHSRHAVNIRANKLKPEKQFLTVCLNLAQLDKRTSFPLSDNRFLQFFYHHSFIGIENFLVYDTDDLLSPKVRQTLFKNNINVNILPYNFPFESHQTKQVQRILEMDCLYRTKIFSQYAIISTPNEFLYTDANIKSPVSPLKQLKKYAVDKNLFELPVRTICVEKQVAQLAHNNRSRIDAKEMTFSLYRADYKFDDSDAVRVEGDKISVHRYVSCDDANVSTLDWRTTVPASYLEYYDTIAREVQIMCSHEG